MLSACKCSFLTPWSLSHSCEYFPIHWLRRKLHYCVKGVREPVLHLPGTCNKTSYSLPLCERSLHTPTESVAAVFLQVQPCFKLFAFNIISCFFNNIPLVYQLFTLISLTTKSKAKLRRFLSWHDLFYFILTYVWKPLINMQIKSTWRRYCLWVILSAEFPRMTFMLCCTWMSPLWSCLVHNPRGHPWWIHLLVGSTCL